MSINVTVSGNPINIRRGRVVLSDLDQIKKNERDRRRRLRLEQVRQQSKEISSRLLERARNIALQELEKLEKDEKSELKRLHDRKIMEIQQKYQEGLESIGKAHADAARETESLATRKDDSENNRLIALKRGKEALQRLQKQDKDDLHAIHRQRLQQVRELENKRSSLVAELSKKTINQDKADDNVIQEDYTSTHENENLHKSTKKKKLKRLSSKKSPVKLAKVNEKVSPEACGKKCVTANRIEKDSGKNIQETVYADHVTQDDEHPRETAPVLSTSTKAEKIARYNPGDYAQDSSDSMSNDSPSLSDDSSYFSDVCDQSTCITTPKHHTSLKDSKVQLYDHTTRQRNIYNRPLDVVERLDIRNEPNAVDAAREVERTESMHSHVTENHKLASQKRGDDAILREKVRSDYKTLIKNLDHLASEERKLKASDIQTNPMDDVNLRKTRRKELQKEQNKRLNRAFEAIADKSCCSSHCPNMTERIVTLAPIHQSEDHKKPEGTWKEPQFVDTQAPVIKSPKSKEKSREELILDMLKKVERQKRLLLQEFGTSLPNDIYRASITSLTELEKSHEPQKKLDQQTQLSSEVTLINMSNGEDDTGSRKKPAKKSTTKKCEMAVQTSTLQDAGIAEDKGVQVELIEVKSDTTDGITTVESEVPPKYYPLEPIITIINPEVEDSSSSTNSMLPGVIIDIDNTEVKVTPKKKKGVLKVSKRTSVRSTQKAHSAPPSKTSSPIKRFSKSLPSSCRSSPRKINIHINRNGMDVKVDPLPHDIKPVADSSTDSSPMYSSINTQDSSISKPYEVHTKSRRAIRIRETSDTSTSFASPPPLEPKRYVNVASNITPILEMLDSSAYSSIERTKIDISPVSTPETPSPRTMMMPSNVPHSERISKILKYGDSERSNHIKESLSNQGAYSRFHQRRENISSEHHRIYSHHLPSLSKPCTCKNPNCNLLHVQLEDVQDFALKNCPEILKKYEDLQSMCTERIASLSDLIEKVRKEQRGMELSVISPHDETSFMEIQPDTQSDLQSVQRLIKNIEAIHKQLTKTLIESQRTTNNESINQDSLNDTQNQIKNFKHKSKLEHPVSRTTEYASEDTKTKSKPRIVKEEKVNIKLNRFKVPHKQSSIMTAVTPERNSWPPTKMSVHENKTIEELSKEILEQSKNLDKSTAAFKKIGNIKNADVKLLSKKSDGSKASSPSKSESNDVPMHNEYINLKSKKDADFEPILAGLPKTLPMSTNGHRVNGKNKPPVSLQSGFFRTEIESIGHELSTIVEFDTPDTASKSHTNLRNSIANSLVIEGSHAENSAIKKSVEVQTNKSSVTVKPSVHVAPLPVSDPVDKRSPSTKKSPREMFSSKLQEVATECNISRRTKGEMHLEYRTADGSIGFVDCVKEKVNKQLQCNTSDPKPKQAEQLFEQASGVSDKGKVSSTSSNSFYELSGISEITSTPPSSLFKYASSIEEIETELKKLHLNWGITLLKKTREASALSSSSNSDITPLNTARRMISPTKKHVNPTIGNLLDFSDVSSISIKEASKSTEQAVLLKGRTSTPKLQNSNSNSDKSNSVASNSSGISFHEPSDSLTVPNVSLKTKPNISHTKGL